MSFFRIFAETNSKMKKEIKSALVTGASSGLGLAFARQLVSHGCALALVSNREEELLAAAAGLRESSGVTVHARCMDLSLPGAAEEVLRWCDGLGFRPELLVNNAGMFFMEYLDPQNLAKARTMVSLHVSAVTELCILFGARMKEQGRGYILNISSMTARIPAPGIAVYSATKAYLRSFGKGLSHELRPFGVTVTTVCPAAVDTGLYPLGKRLRRRLRRIGIIRSPEWMVHKSLRALLRGRRIYAPGLMNAVVPALVALLPNRLEDRLGMKWIKSS